MRRLPFQATMAILASAAMLTACSTTAVQPAATGTTTMQDRVELALMTWVEVKAAITAGKTTALIYNGGTETRGPQAVNGGHTLVAQAKGYRFVTYVSSRAVTWPESALGENCFVYENVVIKPFARLGRDVVVETGSVVGHHAEIQDHCFLGPHSVILGECVIEPYCIIGANALIPEGKEIPDGSLVMGTPGKVIRSLTENERKALEASAAHYVANFRRYLRGLVPQG